MTVGTRPEKGEPQIGSMVGGGERERTSERGREHPGGFPWCWARREGHVAKHQISWAAGLGGVRFSKNGIMKCSRGISVFLCSFGSVWVVGGKNQERSFQRMQAFNFCHLKTPVLMLNTFVAPKEAWSRVT